ncbi:MAG: HAD-IC family P-type ATPase, partial [Candidatus Gracilibacteria bacterium]
MHTKDQNQIFKAFNTKMLGLDSTQLKELQIKYGKNEIKGKKRTPLIIQFFEEFKDLMVIILIIAAILAGIGGKTVDASVILFIVILNATIGFIQKFKAEKALEALKKMVQPHAKVIRDGREKIIDARDLVPGDILIIEEGDKIGADARLIEVNNLEIDESTLTGESRPVKKITEAIDKKHLNHDEHENMIFMGTAATKGNGKAVVVKIGMETMFGRITHLTTTTKKDLSPLQKELIKLGIFAGKITLVISIILFCVGYFVQGQSFSDTILFATSVAVAAVPEGLPATITIALALGVQRLAKKNAIMKQLSSVETLGSTTVICTDKTGTITKNEMTVKEIFIPEYKINISGTGYEPKGSLIVNNKEFDHKSNKNPELTTSLNLLGQAATLCNNSQLAQEENVWSIIGDPTEGALLTVSEKIGTETKKITTQWKRVLEIPFSSERKMMSIICSGKYEKTTMILSKGAPDVVLNKCTHALINGKLVEMDKELTKEISKNNDRMARMALRVLAFAYKPMKREKKYDEKTAEEKLIFIGLTGMMDPPREEVPAAVALTHKAGIKTYIITGDYGPTAESIARQVGIVSSKNPRIITGAELETFSETRLSKVLKMEKEIIFSRVSPEHKLKIISALKKNGEIVAMTGDGVNDAPALKRADIGIAMGIAGTDVSREASNMVLADDSYSTIVAAVEEGRKIYQNLRKFIFYTFSCNIGELVTVFASI